jgi:FkbM family methyltransferase
MAAAAEIRRALGPARAEGQGLAPQEDPADLRAQLESGGQDARRVDACSRPLNLDVFFDIVRAGGHDPHVSQVCAELLGTQQVFYDVGANVGYLSLAVAKAVPHCTVVAFEPQPGLAASLARSAGLNGLGNIAVVPAMVGASDGRGSLFLPGHPFHATAAAPEGDAQWITTLICTLDTLVESGAIPAPDVIKIDVEVGERDVLQGAESVIRQRRPAVVFEAISEHTQRFGYERDDLFRLLAQYGDYEFKGIRSDGSLISVEAGLEDPEVRDFAAIPAVSA